MLPNVIAAYIQGSLSMGYQDTENEVSCHMEVR